MLLQEDDKTKLRSILYDFIDLNCLWRANPDKVYFEGLPPGKTYGKNIKSLNTHQFFLRNLTHNPIMVSYACMLIADRIITSIQEKREYSRFQFAGLETSSIPLISALQQYFMNLGEHSIPINSFIVRKERKDYGLFNLIDGIPEPNVPVMYIDDLINKASTISKVHYAIHYEFGLTPTKNLYTIMQMRDLNLLKIDDNDIVINSLFNKHEFDVTYNEDKYWYPQDCTLDVNKKPDYR